MFIKCLNKEEDEMYNLVAYTYCVIFAIYSVYKRLERLFQVENNTGGSSICCIPTYCWQVWDVGILLLQC